ncbi:hypothetical protein G195_001705 [Phytophthora kernoviae 00238/432]|uniref:ZIP family metal transporter n=1 Tax=Phytophthora kernoviae 00238/432 TaxID=1284355 RepID=A0A8J4WQ12_9STRA|nr:hypothetical protein G195_001705 [Phytophthora kernoviae 00238/432]
MRKVTHRLRDILLAYAAGIMTSASVYNLIPEALGQSNLFVLALGIMLGSMVLLVLEMKIPHVDLENPEKMPFKIEAKAFMIIAAITMHNLPEGLSNAPEGFLVALFLVNQNIGRFKALGIATLTGAVEIVTAMIGYTLSSLVSGLVPYGLAFAAGAMMFIVYKELIPESHGDGNARAATVSFLLGLITMIGLTELF